MQNFTIKIKENIVDRFFGMKKKGQITTEDPLPEIQEGVKKADEPEAHDYDKEYQKKFLEETKPQKKPGDTSEDHDYKGPVEVTLEESPKPLETQEDREKELKKGQIEDYRKDDDHVYFIPPQPGGKPTENKVTYEYRDYLEGFSRKFGIDKVEAEEIIRQWLAEKELRKGQVEMSDFDKMGIPPIEDKIGEADFAIDSTGGDCPHCSAIWDEDTREEYHDMGEVVCPECGERITSFDKEGQKKRDGRGSKTPERVKELAEDLKGKADEPYGLATHVRERERRRIPHRGPGDGRRLDYEEVKGLPREGQRVAIFDNGGESEDRYFAVIGRKAYTIRNNGVATFVGDAAKFDIDHIIRSTRRVATKDVAPRVQRAIFRRVVGIRRGQLSETDPMQMTTGKPTSEIEKIKPTRKPVDEPIDVIMTPSIERSKGAGTPIDPTFLAEQIVRGLRYSHYHTAQEGFNHIIRATKDITSNQIEKLQALMLELGYDVSEQKGDIVKTG